MPRFRHRSSSVGPYQEGSLTTCNKINNKSQQEAGVEDAETAKRLLSSLLYIRDCSGKSFLHTRFNLTMAKLLLDRAKSLDDQTKTQDELSLQRRFLLQADSESGYTPFHRAIVEGNLSAMLLFLRHAMNRNSDGQRLTQRPMTVLHAADSPNGAKPLGSDLLKCIAAARDKEGFTPLELLGKLQQSELEQCRNMLSDNRPQVLLEQQHHQRRPRQSSFDDGAQQELDFLSNRLHLLEQQDDDSDSHKNSSYACEVVTFGRPHHCALGVVQGSSSNAIDDHHASAFCPQRVQEFAQERIGRDRSSVAVAAAAHHTLVALKNGHLYAFGLGKGGRLGIGDDQSQQCPLPRRVLGPLTRRQVVGVAAAENHSLCVTRDGSVFAWGSNRFGQLGDTLPSGTSSSGGAGSNCRYLPRRVEDLKQISCVAVAAGEKHSVALSRKGEVYVWGDNTSGQLGVARRSGIQKVQRVEALWNSAQPKITIAIAASEQSTLVLTSPTPGLTHLNSVYSWGHGNHVPIRIHFDTHDGQQQQRQQQKGSLSSRRVVNPVAIACAKYHNAAITSDGHVYTWGLHADSLGRTNGKGTKKQPQQRNSSSGRSTSSPQLVTGMLPENGGGVAVAVAASATHTAVVTDCGALYTWGATHGKNVLGHEGVSWQPSPKRVAGVHRAINVAVAKEHTVLMIGTSFPQIPKSTGLSSLELLSARKVAEHVDLFNAVPILIMAERSECNFLIDYCSHFIRRNLDGVLNVGKKSEMNQYLNDMLADSLHCSGKRYRDEHHHPFNTDVLTVANQGRPAFDRDWLSSTEEWIAACRQLSRSHIVQRLLALAASREQAEDFSGLRNRRRRASSCTSDCGGSVSQNRSASGATEPESKVNSTLTSEMRQSCLDKCIKKTTNMDLSTTELVKENSIWLAKEMRGVRKKLNQIAKLEELEELSIVLSTEQRAKVDRRPLLEAELLVYEAAYEEVELRIRELSLEDQKQRQSPQSSEDAHPQAKPKGKEAQVALKLSEDDEKGVKTMGLAQTQTFSCDICGIKCPDETSFALHQNGRRHRNRVAHVAGEERKIAAASIVEQHQLEQVRAASATTPNVKKKKKNVWGVPNGQPKYKLPPPPHPATTPVAPAMHISASRPSHATSSDHIETGTTTPLVSPAANFRQILKGEVANEQSPKRNANIPFPGSPIWACSPGSTRCVPLTFYSVPDLTPTAMSGTGRNSYSLADFLAPKPLPSPKAQAAAPWSNKKPSTIIKRRSLAEIQAEETDFKARQDQSFGQDAGSWFIERRERADSLLQIQNSAKKELAEHMLVEEQMRIEAQIQEERSQQRQKEKKQQDGAKKKRQQRRKTKKGNGGSKEMMQKVNSLETGEQETGNSKGKKSKKRNGMTAGKDEGEGIQANRKRKNDSTPHCGSTVRNLGPNGCAPSSSPEQVS